MIKFLSLVLYRIHLESSSLSIVAYLLLFRSTFVDYLIKYYHFEHDTNFVLVFEYFITGFLIMDLTLHLLLCIQSVINLFVDYYLAIYHFGKYSF